MIKERSMPNVQKQAIGNKSRVQGPEGKSGGGDTGRISTRPVIAPVPP